MSDIVADVAQVQQFLSLHLQTGACPSASAALIDVQCASLIAKFRIRSPSVQQATDILKLIQEFGLWNEKQKSDLVQALTGSLASTSQGSRQLQTMLDCDAYFTEALWDQLLADTP